MKKAQFSAERGYPGLRDTDKRTPARSQLLTVHAAKFNHHVTPGAR